MTADFDISRRHLVGKMVFTRRAGCRILSVKVPEIPNTFIVDHNDLAINKATFFGDEVQVFATDRSLWVGQCLLAAFAPDWETLDRLVSAIEVTYDGQDVDPDAEGPVLSQTYTDGYTGEFEGRVVSSEFVFNSHSAPLLGDQRMFVTNRNGHFGIRLSTQWPMNVREGVSTCLDLDPKDVAIDTVHFNVAFDQLVSRPSLVAIAACAGSLKSGMDVEFSCPSGSNHPAIRFDISTVFDDDGNILKQISDVVVDMGCYPIVAQEYANSIVAGMIPVYAVKAIETRVTIKCSPNPPANIFGDLGYSVALAACENHYSKLIRALDQKQGDWRAQKASEGRIQKAALRSTVFERIPESIRSCMKDSWFDRQMAAFGQKVFSEIRVNPLVNYNRGVAIACGQGVQGFSSKFPYKNQYGACATLSRNGKLEVGLSVSSNSMARKGHWTRILSELLEIPKDDIKFLDINDSRVSDMGPDVLGRSTRYVPPLLENLAGKINAAREDLDTQYPIVVSTDVSAIDIPEQLFDSDSAACMVMALRIDPVMMIPVVDHVWARVCYGSVYNRESVESTLKQVISLTIREVCPCAENNYDINLQFSEDTSKPAGSAQSLLRGLTISCVANALSQALHHDIYKLPVREHDILGIINRLRTLREKKPEDKPQMSEGEEVAADIDN